MGSFDFGASTAAGLDFESGLGCDLNSGSAVQYLDIGEVGKGKERLNCQLLAGGWLLSARGWRLVRNSD